MSKPTMNESSGDWNKLKHLVDLSAENARLKAEVERLRKFNEEAMAHIAKEERKSWERLDMVQDEVERLRKAGDAMVLKLPDMMAGVVKAEEAIGLMNDWIAAKEGKQP